MVTTPYIGLSWQGDDPESVTMQATYMGILHSKKRFYLLFAFRRDCLLHWLSFAAVIEGAEPHSKNSPLIFHLNPWSCN